MQPEELRNFFQEQVLFSNEAANYLGITTQRLNQLVHSGKLTPIKQSKSGTLFLKRDLDMRMKESSSLGEDVGLPVESHSYLRVTPGYIQEACNYFTIQALHSYTDTKAWPVFLEIGSKVDLTLPMPAIEKDVATLLGVDAGVLRKTYMTTLHGFERLLETDFIVKKGTPQYPRLLAETVEAPPFLFMRGNIELLDYRIVSVVGTRHPSDKGRERAGYLSLKLGQYGIVVASGLAMGIDTAAHTAAVDSGNPTIAVIGTPLNKVYPKENAELQNRIAEHGLVISQFQPAGPTQRWHFPLRNATMSGISLATVIVEAGETSGALKQANYALKQKRLVFIPQSALENESMKWPKEYIKREGAHRFGKVSELLELLQKHKVLSTDKIESTAHEAVEGVDDIYVPGSDSTEGANH